ncbi:MAG: N-6 DNA methylase [Acetatifactor sp.]|nr:N-6 DNA methylase [Acetatifactor sp.]
MLDLFSLYTDIKNEESGFRRQMEDIVQEIYVFLENPSRETARMTAGWREEFAYLYGDAQFSLPEGGQDAHLLFYAMQTGFSILIKVMTREILCESKEQPVQAFGVAQEEYFAQASELLRGEFARQCGIENYVDEDWYCWPLYELERGFDVIIEKMAELLHPYHIELSRKEFVRRNRTDYIKQMYEALIPQKLRHALGEFYTPDWLAERTLQDALKFAEKPVEELRLADPTCGSGTFLMQGILAKRRAGCDLENILSSVYGFDINALAVLTARTNYLLAVVDLLEDGEQIKRTHIRLPIYKMDILQLAEQTSDLPISGQADVVIGNPPWVNWEYLPEQYRQQSRHLWTDYGLFSARGRDLSFSKEDISVLITYVAMDKLLKEGGVIGFVIRQGVFKSAQNGVGFRRFQIREECAIRVLKVEDLSRVQAFDNAVTSTALFFARKGRETVYPVPYFVWEKRPDIKSCSPGAYAPLSEVLAQMNIQEQRAMPVVAQDRTSLWITAEEKRLRKMRRALGSNPYRARTGVFTGGANGVYWLQIYERNPKGIRAGNLVERAKRKVEQVEAELEPDYIFPMIKGRNVQRWRVTYDSYLLCPHTEITRMWPVCGEELRETCPLTYAYLSRFREELDNRKGFAGWEKEIQRQEFHAILRVGDYTFSRYKVVWKYIAREFVCAVVGETEDRYLGRKICLPNEKVMYIATEDEEEAYYLCGILSSSLIADCVKSYMNPTSISAHVLDKLYIPPFDAEDERHRAIAAVCREGHEGAEVQSCLDRIDELVEQIYGSRC